ncbi:vgr related protein [Sphingomonas sp.]|jgi:hypothetical protein|uniref:vgr related protein n=1 Tax=Sphingomonas sp. TaxID=28214 RepID=UPI002D7FE455|nr:vgr related protein [Sphingomonas sp.]HEU0045187.1 vgr related protein [Sphingomonas sp.]
MSESRQLTAGEIREARTIFGAAIDYAKVIVNRGKAYFFQPADVAITPNGQIYFPVESYKPDFSGNASDAAWLIHELTHVWQSQQGMWVRTRGILNRNYDYGDLSQSSLRFLDQGIEVQASIVGDYYRLRHGLPAVHGSGALADYERVIPFLPRSGR